jgi:hypothetical protein
VSVTCVEELDLEGRLAGDLGSLSEFARELGGRPEGGMPRRINADQSTAERDLAKLVLSLVDLVRRLMERQAARRVNAGSLTDEEVERMGETFLKLERRMDELRAAFDLAPEDLELDLGPLRDLL